MTGPRRLIQMTGVRRLREDWVSLKNDWIVRHGFRRLMKGLGRLRE